MKRIGFVTSPLSTGHATRGVGFYTKNLLSHLKTQAPKANMEIIELTAQPTSCPADQLDLIHFPFFDPFYPTLPVWRPAKTVVTIHDVTPLEFPDHYPPGVRGWLTLQRQKLALASVDRILTDSYSSIQSIHQHLHVPHSKLKLVYLAAASHFQPISNSKKLVTTRSKYHLPAKFVLFVGDINWNKNIPTLVSACQQLDLPLVIVGKQAAQLESLDLTHPELAHLVNHKSLILNHSVRLGFIPDNDLVAIYNLATLYCQPSYAEGFGLPILEAMACGCPVACAATHSLPELAGEAAVYFDPYNEDAMAQALNQLATDAKLRSSLIAAGFAQNRKFTWTKTATDTLSVYREIL